MKAFTARIFRDHMVASLGRVDAGEQTWLKRAVEQARKEHHEGKTLRFSSAAEAQKWMDEL